jgi:RecA-family ATPase
MGDDGFAAYDARQVRSAEIWIADTAWCEAELPRRRWVAPKYALRGAVTVIAGPPSAMKSSLMLAWGCAGALGKPHGDFQPREPGIVLIFNVEDDADEQRRRLSAVLRQFHATPTDIAGKVVCIGPRETGTLFACADDAEIVATPLMLRLREIIAERRPALFIADPFGELHALDENSNSAVRAVIAQFRALAVEFDMAVVLIHHTRKGTIEPGDPDILRGGSAIVGGGRSVFTLLPMAEKDSETLGLPIDRKSRSRYMRLDDAKLNYADIGEAKWYEKIPYDLDNG